MECVTWTSVQIFPAQKEANWAFPKQVASTLSFLRITSIISCLKSVLSAAKAEPLGLKDKGSEEFFATYALGRAKPNFLGPPGMSAKWAPWGCIYYVSVGLRISLTRMSSSDVFIGGEGRRVRRSVHPCVAHIASHTKNGTRALVVTYSNLQFWPLLLRHSSVNLPRPADDEQGRAHDLLGVGPVGSHVAALDHRVAAHRGREEGAGQRVLHSVHLQQRVRGFRLSITMCDFFFLSK